MQTATYTKTMLPNVYKTNTGTYRARKTINGRLLSKNFRTMKAAKAWLNSLIVANN